MEQDMSPHFERIVVISIMTILVSLFTWMYVRDRQRRMGLWMLGWISILTHFAAQTALEFHLIGGTPAFLIALATLDVAGMCFLLSVSQACATPRRRAIFIVLIGIPTIAYTTCVMLQVQHSLQYPVILSLVIATALALSL